MPKIALTEARIKALKPRRNARDIRDARLRGFGVRVLPSGRKYYFIQHQHLGERVWKIIGDAEAVSVGEARALAAEMLAAIRRGDDGLHRRDETLFEAVARTVFERYARVWKAGTLYVNRSYLRKRIMPHFAGRPVADIDRQEVQHWFACLQGSRHMRPDGRSRLPSSAYCC